MDKAPITRAGYLRLINELIYLRRVARPMALDDLREARAFGVKVTNQQYLTAREKHLVVQRKIQELEEKLANCEIVVGRKYFFRQVGFGMIIEIENIDTGDIYRYQLVGPYESDVSNGKLSISSPVGSCLMGCCEGDEVAVDTPSGERVYRVIEIEL